jgi:hypothetical protein
MIDYKDTNYKDTIKKRYERIEKLKKELYELREEPTVMQDINDNYFERGTLFIAWKYSKPEYPQIIRLHHFDDGDIISMDDDGNENMRYKYYELFDPEKHMCIK